MEAVAVMDGVAMLVKFDVGVTALLGVMEGEAPKLSVAVGVAGVTAASGCEADATSAEAVRAPEALIVKDGVELAEDVGVAPPVPLPLGVVDGLAPYDSELVGLLVGVALTLGEAELDSVALELTETLEDAEGLAPLESVAVGLVVSVELVLGVAEPVPLTLLVAAAEAESVIDDEGVGLGVAAAVMDGEVVAVGEGVAPPLLEAVKVGVIAPVGDTLAVPDTLEPKLGVCEGVLGIEGVPVPLNDEVWLLVTAPEGVADADAPRDKLLVGVAVNVGVVLGVSELEGV